MTDTHEDNIERVKAAARREFEIHRTGNMDNLWLRVARAAIEAMQQWREEQGLIVVPRTPTPEMLSAAFHAWIDGDDDEAAAYKAMVDAISPPTKP